MSGNVLEVAEGGSRAIGLASSIRSASYADDLFKLSADGAAGTDVYINPVDSGPVETVSNLTATHGESFAASSLFTYSDPVGSAATEYDVWDTGGGGGYFALNGTALGANQNNIITAAQLSQLTVSVRLGREHAVGCRRMTARCGVPGRRPSR